MYKIFRYEVNNRLLECEEIGRYHAENKVVEELRRQYVVNSLEPYNFTVGYWNELDYEGTMDYELDAQEWLFRLGVTIKLV